MSSGVKLSIAASSELIVELIMLAFFSCSSTIRLSTESSIQRRVIAQGRLWPMRWHRSADCHSAAGFHHLFCDQLFIFNVIVWLWTYGSTMKTWDASVRLRATPPAFSDTRKHSQSTFCMKWLIDPWRWAGVMLPSSITVVMPALRRRHSTSWSWFDKLHEFNFQN